jgi:hypothetical protein
VVLLDEAHRKGVKLRFAPAVQTGMVLRALEVSDVEESCNQEIERGEGLLFDGEASIAIRRVATLHLNADLPGYRVRVRVDAHQIVAPIVGRGLVRQDTPNGDLWWWRQTGNQWTWIGNSGVAAGTLAAALSGKPCS